MRARRRVQVLRRVPQRFRIVRRRRRSRGRALVYLGRYGVAGGALRRRAAEAPLVDLALRPNTHAQPTPVR